MALYSTSSRWSLSENPIKDQESELMTLIWSQDENTSGSSPPPPNLLLSAQKWEAVEHPQQEK